MTEHHLHHHHHHEVSEKSIRLLIVSFAINILLSAAEIIGGIIAGSISLIGDALHNTSDAFSILIAVIAFKIGRRKASEKYTYGFKRAEVIGGFVNLILLFISGCYLFIEGIFRLIDPQPIEGKLIIIISVLALIIDAVTAKISHHGAAHNTNMKMVFIHNLADAFGSVGVIISGVFVMYFDIFWMDGLIALCIAAYMIYQSVLTFPKTVNILMNAAPDHLNVHDISRAIEDIEGVRNVHHIHLWCINENDVALDCHIQASDVTMAHKVAEVLQHRFDIHHCNIQIEDENCCQSCEL